MKHVGAPLSSTAREKVEGRNATETNAERALMRGLIDERVVKVAARKPTSANFTTTTTTTT